MPAASPGDLVPAADGALPAAAHPLAAVLREAAVGRFPHPDGGWELLRPWRAGVRAVVSLTGHAFVCADGVDREQLEALGCDGFGGAAVPGRSGLVEAALDALPAEDLVLAAVAPGNARSLRAFVRAGFVPLGSVQVFHP